MSLYRPIQLPAVRGRGATERQLFPPMMQVRGSQRFYQPRLQFDYAHLAAEQFGQQIDDRFHALIVRQLTPSPAGLLISVETSIQQIPLDILNVVW